MSFEWFACCYLRRPFVAIFVYSFVYKCINLYLLCIILFVFYVSLGMYLWMQSQNECGLWFNQICLHKADKECCDTGQQFHITHLSLCKKKVNQVQWISVALQYTSTTYIVVSVN